MTLDIQHLEELYGKTTKGEWSPGEIDADGDGCNLPDALNVKVNGSRWGKIVNSVSISPDDAAFIAAIHTAFPLLLDRLKAEEWQPIETAPKDGSVIDVWREEGGRSEIYWGFPHHECGEMGGLCDSDWHRIKKPGWVCSHFGEFIGGRHNPFTHWRPLPAPPRAEEGER
ncbi:MAG: hypothetical protein KA105_02530 [Caulobacter sp.]|nr:hypothetical protein [Caulobacter sp.]